MKLRITRIDNSIITCEIDDTDSLIDISKEWFPTNVRKGNVINFDIESIINK